MHLSQRRVIATLSGFVLSALLLGTTPAFADPSNNTDELPAATTAADATTDSGDESGTDTETTDANAEAADQADADFTATLEVSNPKADGAPWQVGETINFAMEITNETTTNRSFQALDSNMENWSGCKWTNLAAGTSQPCNFAKHVVTQEDVDRGYFEPTVTWGMYPQTGYSGAVQRLAPTVGDRIPVTQQVAELITFEKTSEAKESYATGDQLTFSLSAKNISQNPVTFKLADSSPVKGACSTDPVEAEGALSCTNLTYTITDTDRERGSVDVEVYLDAFEGDTVLQRLTDTIPVDVPTTWEKATGFEAPDANPNLAANLADIQLLDDSTADHKIRIPAIAVASNGDVLASYDLRPMNGGANGGDSPNANWIVQRRSTDNGENWGPMTVIAQGTSEPASEREGYSDPSYVVDYTTGTIFNFHVYSQQSGVVANDPGYVVEEDGNVDESNDHTMNLGLSVSTDNGHTWTEKIITSEVLGAKAADLQSCFATSGAGTQKMQNPNKGRLLQQAMCIKKDQSWVAFTIYSDDNGASWQSGNFTSVTEDTEAGAEWVFNENKVVELSNGDLMLNSRTDKPSSSSSSPAKGYRIQAISKDGGVTWQDYSTADQLVDPGNNAQIIRAFPNAEPDSLRSQVLLYSHTDNSSKRYNGTIKMSCDNGETWPISKEFLSNHTGYTTMAVQTDGTIGLMLEPGDTPGSEGESVAYTNFTLSWLSSDLCSEPKLADTSVRFAIDGEPVSIPLEFDNDDPTLANTVTFEGLPAGLTYNAENKTIEGTTHIGNASQQRFDVQVHFTEADDGTGVPRQAEGSFTLALEEAGFTGEHEYEGNTYYVSASGNDSNNGLTEQTPFETLAKINELTLKPGDKVLLHRGDTFVGQYLHLKGSGSADASIKVSSYGDQTKGKPVINTNGQGIWQQDYHTPLDSSAHKYQGSVSSSILLKDVEYVEVSDLEITNDRLEGDAGNYNDTELLDRTGVAVIAENIGTVNHVVLEDLYIHDVDGNIYDKHMANGGIYVIAHKPEDASNTQISRFDDVQILNNRVETVDRWGIGVGYSAYTGQFSAAEISDQTIKEYGQTNVVVRGNYVKDAGGDAITVFYSDRPIVESNVSEGAAVHINNTDYTKPGNKGGKVAATIWPWKTKNAVFQYNESFNTRNGAQGNDDAQAWDADWGDGTLYQYNYSHGNTGGTVMFCGSDAINSTFRYNISQNDLLGIIDIPGNPNAHVYNNTFYIAQDVPVLGRHATNGGATIENNIFYYAGDAPRTENWTGTGQAKTYDHNLYYNYANKPAGDANAVVVAKGTNVMENPGSGPTQVLASLAIHPHEGETTAFDGYTLVAGSPAANTGKVIVDENGYEAVTTDFLKQSVAGTPDIGAIAADGTAPEPSETPTTTPTQPATGDVYDWVRDYKNDEQGPVWFAQYQENADSEWENIEDYDSAYPNWVVDQYYGPGLDFENHTLPDADSRGDIHGLLSDSPETSGGIAMAFKAPKAGQVTFTVKDDEPYLRQAGNTGGTVTLKLMKNDEVLQSVTLTDSQVKATDWKNFTAEDPITVEAGDYLRVVAVSDDSPSKPSIHISPVITYLADEPVPNPTTTEPTTEPSETTGAPSGTATTQAHSASVTGKEVPAQNKGSKLPKTGGPVAATVGLATLLMVAGGALRIRQKNTK